jgi:hypothetical protein
MLRDVLTAVEAAPTLNLHPKTFKPFYRIGKLTDKNVRIRRVGEEIYLSLEPDDRSDA